MILGTIGIYCSGDATSVLSNGFFYGYTYTVVSVILLQAIGGLVVAVVVKYADNILKGFAASFSIVTSCVVCYFFFDFKPTFLFLVGAFLVLLSSYMYERGLPSLSSFLFYFGVNNLFFMPGASISNKSSSSNSGINGSNTNSGLEASDKV